jgi:hypothetical protein
MLIQLLEWADFLFNALTASQLRTIYNAVNTMRVYFAMIINKLNNTPPSLMSIALLLVILFVSLKLLDMAWRAMVFWLNLAAKIVFWASMVLLVTWIWTRGPDGFMDDVQDLVTFWLKEYHDMKMRVRVEKELRKRRHWY